MVDDSTNVGYKPAESFPFRPIIKYKKLVNQFYELERKEIVPDQVKDLITSLFPSVLDEPRSYPRQKAKSECLMYSKTTIRSPFRATTDHYIINVKHEVETGTFGPFYNEEERLKSFDGFESKNVNPKDLAKAGFYWLKTSDKVSCAFCKGNLEEWCPGDSPLFEHYKYFPTCPFLLNIDVGNIPIPYDNKGTTEISRANDYEPLYPTFTTTGLGLNTTAIKYPDFMKFSVRCKSFELQKFFIEFPTKFRRDLCEMGFFCFDSTTLKCYVCGYTFSQSDAFMESDYLTPALLLHCSINPKCLLLITIFGEPLMREIEKSIENGFSINHSDSNDYDVCRSAVQYRIAPNELRARLDTAPVRYIINMGYSKKLVETVLGNQLKHTGSGFTNSTQLLKAVQSVQAQMKEAHITDPEQFLKNKEEEWSRQRSRKRPAHEMSSRNATRDATEKPDPTPFDDEVRSIKDLKAYSQELRHLKMCKICMDREVDTVFLQCGHLMTCKECSENLTQCPICRKQIVGIVRTSLRN